VTRACLGAAVALPLLAACIRAPSPLAPEKTGSIGLPHRGTLSQGEPLADEGPGFARLRKNERRFGTPALVGAIRRAAGAVEKARAGSVLVIGDLSEAHGGVLLPHLSHRSGRDADLLLYVETLEGAHIRSPGFIHFGADGLGWDPAGKRFLRFDVEREWMLIKALVTDDEARVQWVFLSHELEPLVMEWARAKGEPPEVLKRAEEVLLEPKPGGAHDDHTHIRVACSDQELALGCEPNGPDRPWFWRDGEAEPPPTSAWLVREISEPIARLDKGSAQ
jgi:penicillin-insensitive murein DD-endopeptidase